VYAYIILEIKPCVNYLITAPNLISIDLGSEYGPENWSERQPDDRLDPRSRRRQNLASDPQPDSKADPRSRRGSECRPGCVSYLLLDILFKILLDLTPNLIVDMTSESILYMIPALSLYLPDELDVALNADSIMNPALDMIPDPSVDLSLDFALSHLFHNCSQSDLN
jgi:hypothetical protein